MGWGSWWERWTLLIKRNYTIYNKCVYLPISKSFFEKIFVVFPFPFSSPTLHLCNLSFALKTPKNAPIDGLLTSKNDMHTCWFSLLLCFLETYPSWPSSCFLWWWIILYVISWVCFFVSSSNSYCCIYSYSMFTR